MVGERARPCASPLAPRQRTRCLTRSAGCPAWRRAGWQRGCGGKEAAALCAGVGGGVYGRARFFCRLPLLEPGCGALVALRGGRERRATWLILPVVIRLSQRLSHACLSINNSIL